MLIGVPAEVVPGEKRVALVPETVGRLVQGGNGVLVQRGAGTAAAFRDEAYEAAGATLAADAAELYAKADIVVKVARPTSAEFSAHACRASAAWIPRPARRSAVGRSLRGAKNHRTLDGRHPAHDQSAIDGRPLLTGQRCGIQGRAHCRCRTRKVLSDADDGSRHGQAGAGARDRRGRRRTASDCDGAALRRRRHGL